MFLVGLICALVVGNSVFAGTSNSVLRVEAQSRVQWPVSQFGPIIHNHHYQYHPIQITPGQEFQFYFVWRYRVPSVAARELVISLGDAETFGLGYFANMKSRFNIGKSNDMRWKATLQWPIDITTGLYVLIIRSSFKVYAVSPSTIFQVTNTIINDHNNIINNNNDRMLLPSLINIQRAASWFIPSDIETKAVGDMVSIGISWKSTQIPAPILDEMRISLVDAETMGNQFCANLWDVTVDVDPTDRNHLLIFTLPQLSKDVDMKYALMLSNARYTMAVSSSFKLSSHVHPKVVTVEQIMESVSKYVDTHPQTSSLAFISTLQRNLGSLLNGDLNEKIHPPVNDDLIQLDDDDDDDDGLSHQPPQQRQQQIDDYSPFVQMSEIPLSDGDEEANDGKAKFLRRYQARMFDPSLTGQSRYDYININDEGGDGYLGISRSAASQTRQEYQANSP